MWMWFRCWNKEGWSLWILTTMTTAGWRFHFQCCCLSSSALMAHYSTEWCSIITYATWLDKIKIKFGYLTCSPATWATAIASCCVRIYCKHIWTWDNHCGFVYCAFLCFVAKAQNKVYAQLWSFVTKLPHLLRQRDSMYHQSPSKKLCSPLAF